MSCKLTRLFHSICIAIIAVVCSAYALSAQTDVNRPFEVAEGQGVFLIVTDIHFDPFTQPSIVPELDRSVAAAWPKILAAGSGKGFQGYGSDAGYLLTRSALQAAVETGITFDYILYTGDYLSHRFNRDYRRYAGSDPQGLESFAVKTAEYVSGALQSHFPDMPVFGVLGNTDAACGDYQIAPGSGFTAGLKAQWQTLSRQPAAFEDFDLGGYYKVTHPTVPDYDIVVLNDIFWSIKYQDNCNDHGGDPGDEMMSWLDRQLDQIRQDGRKAYILLHVPPGINAYSTANGSGTCVNRIEPYWTRNYGDGFNALMRKHADVVDFTFSGHTHMDSFVILKDAQGDPAVAGHITPAVSPIFENNPAFTAYLYDRKTGTILDAATWYLTNLEDTGTGAPAIWVFEYTFTSTYGVPDMSAQSLARAARTIKSDKTAKSFFTRYYAASAKNNNPIDSSNFEAFSCALTAVTKQDYQDCYCMEK